METQTESTKKVEDIEILKFHVFDQTIAEIVSPGWQRSKDGYRADPKRALQLYYLVTRSRPLLGDFVASKSDTKKRTQCLIQDRLHLRVASELSKIETAKQLEVQDSVKDFEQRVTKLLHPQNEKKVKKRVKNRSDKDKDKDTLTLGAPQSLYQVGMPEHIRLQFQSELLESQKKIKKEPVSKETLLTTTSKKQQPFHLDSEVMTLLEETTYSSEKVKKTQDDKRFELPPLTIGRIELKGVIAGKIFPKLLSKRAIALFIERDLHFSLAEEDQKDITSIDALWMPHKALSKSTATYYIYWNKWNRLTLMQIQRLVHENTQQYLTKDLFLFHAGRFLGDVSICTHTVKFDRNSRKEVTSQSTIDIDSVAETKTKKKSSCEHQKRKRRKRKSRGVDLSEDAVVAVPLSSSQNSTTLIDFSTSQGILQNIRNQVLKDHIDFCLSFNSKQQNKDFKHSSSKEEQEEKKKKEKLSHVFWDQEGRYWDTERRWPDMRDLTPLCNSVAEQRKLPLHWRNIYWKLRSMCQQKTFDALSGGTEDFQVKTQRFLNRAIQELLRICAHLHLNLSPFAHCEKWNIYEKAYFCYHFKPLPLYASTTGGSERAQQLLDVGMFVCRNLMWWNVVPKDALLRSPNSISHIGPVVNEEEHKEEEGEEEGKRTRNKKTYLVSTEGTYAEWRLTCVLPLRLWQKLGKEFLTTILVKFGKTSTHLTKKNFPYQSYQDIIEMKHNSSSSSSISDRGEDLVQIYDLLNLPLHISRMKDDPVCIHIEKFTEISTFLESVANSSNVGVDVLWETCLPTSCISLSHTATSTSVSNFLKSLNCPKKNKKKKMNMRRKGDGKQNNKDEEEEEGESFIPIPIVEEKGQRRTRSGRGQITVAARRSVLAEKEKEPKNKKRKETSDDGERERDRDGYSTDTTSAEDPDFILVEDENGETATNIEIEDEDAESECERGRGGGRGKRGDEGSRAHNEDNLSD